MDQDHRLTRPMIFVVQIDVAGVFLADCNICHRDSPLPHIRVDVDGVQMFVNPARYK